ncbi:MULTISPECIES: hypothetical protein [Methanoculleus]|uniref:Peptidase domain protein n=2 Tax=Methanoculleus TaxID=45989 RepID=A3CXA4_METMJ|nr:MULTISPECIES: hypothetical protein [Methanoculleus]ABN58004.1 hypothetical protein Memar_2079 [Methanoculleus marisnigri JR1]MCC7554669.1 hypothetical protein [Methanoculleus marisnigri]UYU19387.1 hypothetical protein OH143_04670 [Methanoculleus submarinus]
MKPYRIATVIMITAALLIPAVAAQGTGGHNYIVTPIGDELLKEKPLPALRSYDTITQGETDEFSNYIPPGKTELVLDLNWGDPSDSLRLMIYAPDTVLGPYYDSYDGTLDGRIRLRIKDSVGLYPGTWDYEIYGYDVTGTEDYTFGWR